MGRHLVGLLLLGGSMVARRSVSIDPLDEPLATESSLLCSDTPKW